MKNVQAWLEKNLGPSRSSHNGVELSVDCPFCDDQGSHLYYSTVKDCYNCFKCNASGRGLDLIIGVSGMTAYDAAKFLSTGKPVTAKATQILTAMPSWYKPLTEPHQTKPGYEYVYRYALSRKFTTSQLEFYGMGYAIGNYEYRNRLIIPVERGYFQARAIFKSQQPKYINPTSPKEDRLFNHRFLGQKRLAICEGAFSAIAATREDCPAVAVLGKTVTPEQMKRIANSKPDRVEIAFDAGTEKSDATLELAGYLHSQDITVAIRSYDFGDPDECEVFTSYTYKPSYKLRARLERIK